MLFQLNLKDANIINPAFNPSKSNLFGKAGAYTQSGVF